jgi:hypothetical protein
MGYDELQSNYLTIPVYIWGALIFVAVARVSERYRIHGVVSSSHTLTISIVYFLIDS